MKNNPLHWILFISFCIWFSTKSVNYIHQYNDIETTYSNHLHNMKIIEKKLNARLFQNQTTPLSISINDASLVSNALLQITELTFSNIDQTVTFTPYINSKP